MAQKSNIQWTDATWNIARGCTKVDADCKFCYMYRDSMNETRYKPMQVIRTKTVFDMPLKYRNTFSDCWDGNPLIFTSSLTDVFHPEIDGYREEMWDIIRRCPHLTFQILTKRPERINDHLPKDWGDGWDNVWLGTSVGSGESIHRAIMLLNVKSKVRFLSLEPLHGPIDLYPEIPDHFEGYNGAARVELLTGRLTDMARPCGYSNKIDWVIVGGESGNDVGKYRYRPCEIEWVEKIVNECKKAGVPIFVKQLGTHIAKQLRLSDRHGGDINEFPIALRVRQFPKQST